MRRVSIVLLALVTLLSAMAQSVKASSTAKTPDFAFPEKVATTALRDLDDALGNGNGEAVVNALVRFGLAKSLVSADSLRVVLDKIGVVRGKSANPAVKTLLSLLEARIYTEIYGGDSYTIDRRATVAGLAGDDYNLWSKNQFLAKVRELTDSVIAERKVLLETPLESYKSIIRYDRESLAFYPTLYDFAAYQVIDCLSYFSQASPVLNSGLVENPLNRSLYPSTEGSTDGMVLSIYDSLIEGRSLEAPGILARRNLINYILPRVFDRPQPRRLQVFDECHDEELPARYVAFKKAYDECAASQYAIEFLLDIGEETLPAAEKKALYETARQFIADNPVYFNANAVKNLVGRLEQKKVEMDVPRQVAKAVPFKVGLHSVNINRLTLNVYDVSLSATGTNDYYENDYYRVKKALPPAVETIVVELSGNVPFSSDTIVEVSLPEYGAYIIVPSFDGESGNDGNYPFVSCSDLSLGIFNGLSGCEAVAVNPYTGAPRGDVTLRFRPWSRKETARILPGKTDKSGILGVTEKSSGNISPVLSSDKYAPGCYYSKFVPYESIEYVSGNITTDLALYHPGDKVSFAVVLYRDKNYRDKSGSVSLATNHQARIELRDANYQVVDTLRLTTDDWGRMEGSFILPSDGLTGAFTLHVAGDDSRVYCTKRITVSDYKLPTFSVETSSIERPAKIGDKAVISGKATTFAGFPVADGQVKLQLNVRSGYWWWEQVSPVFYEAEARSDARGVFTIEIPGDVMKSGPSPEGRYTATIAVTSADGETHETSATFNIGKPFSIAVNIPDVFEVGGKAKAAVEVVNSMNEQQSVELNYRVVAVTRDLYDGITGYNEVKSGSCMPGSVAELLSTLPSGEYKLSFVTSDETLADMVASGNVVVYRHGDAECPINSMLWLPSESYTANENGEVEIVYGTAVENPHVMMVVSDNSGKMLERRWLTQEAGLNKVSLSMPAESSLIRVYFRIVSRMQSSSVSLTVNSYNSTCGIKLSTETFRDKVLPGDNETITFKVSGVNGASPRSAVMLDMSNMAIDRLAANPLGFAIYGLRGQFMHVDGWNFGSNGVNKQGLLKYLKQAGTTMPVFEFYGQSFQPMSAYGVNLTMSSLRVRGSMKLGTGMAKEESALAYDSSEDEVLVGSVEEHAEVLNVESADAGLSEPRVESDGEQVFRPSELPLAFFRPMLNTDDAGNLEISYTVPDANTTWILRALAYNREMMTATDEVKIIASKPLMVSTNAPRFLRCGDKAILRASVMNAADESVFAVSLCEVIDPMTGEVIASGESVDSIAPMASRVVSMEFEVSADMQGAIFRVRSTAGNFTDGEQSFMPILPSLQNVVESKLFYIAPDNDSFTMELDAVEDGRVFINFTENPTWEVVSALPGLRDGKINSSIEAAAALFSAAVADGLMRSNPEIVRTLRKWSENPADSALTSRLQKNEQLKQVLLSSTPWVSNALSQTERMQRLALLLDSRNVSAAMSKAIADLEKTFDPEGGWYWTKEYPRVSEWCSRQVLDMLGDLNRMGWLPADKKLADMIEKSVKWFDSTTARNYAKYPQADYTLYCYTRVKFPGVRQSTASSKVMSATVQRMISNWKKHDVAIKAVDAIVLANNEYVATARNILESLREFATVTPEKGMWWQQLENSWFMSLNKVGLTAVILDAFCQAEPDCGDIDKIRQWLILNKTNNDWGNAVITSQVVASILTSGRNWTVNPTGTAIHIGDKLLEADSAEYATGAFTRQITEFVETPVTLTIDRQADYPSFGGIVTMRVVPMEEAGAVSCSELSIEKRMSVFDGTEWMPSDSVSVGDRVKVSLVLKADTDLQYLVIEDRRAAGFEPVEQLPVPMWSEGLCFYRENRDESTNIFVERVPRGKYILEYELFATIAGRFSSGAASAQSQYNPIVAAHSAGTTVVIE